MAKIFNIEICRFIRNLKSLLRIKQEYKLNSRADFYLQNKALAMGTLLEQPDDPGLLFLLPYNPLPPSEIKHGMRTLGFDDTQIDKLLEGGITLVSVDLIADYYPLSFLNDARDTLKSLAVRTDLCLLDSYSGFLIWQKNEKYHNRNLTWHGLIHRANSVSKDLGKFYFENKNLDLAQGVYLIKQFFLDAFPPSTHESLNNYIPPALDVSSYEEMLQVMLKIKKAEPKNSPIEFWFRGQNIEYLIPDRTQLVEQSITPWSHIRDPSIVPSLYRNFDNHLASNGDWISLIEEVEGWSAHSREVLPTEYTCHDPLTGDIIAERFPVDGETVKMSLSMSGRHPKAPQVEDIGMTTLVQYIKANGEVTYQFEKRYHFGFSSYLKGLIMQHYGAPTSWIDITRDLKIALWFASQRLFHENGKLKSTQLDWTSNDKSSWPVIYVFPLIKGLHQFLDSAAMLRETDSLRPQRQLCGLLGGAGNLARNYPARNIGFKFRLSPNFKFSDLPTLTELFPGPDEDKVLRRLLELEKILPGVRNYPVHK
jgi:hypothetical protein